MIEMIEMIDKLFKDITKFTDNGVIDDGLLLDGLVFYNKGKLVVAIMPNHFGYDLNTQPALKTEEKLGPFAFSERQLAKYDMIAKWAMYNAHPFKEFKPLPSIKLGEQAAPSNR
jgi:hypothetical protein